MPKGKRKRQQDHKPPNEMPRPTRVPVVSEEDIARAIEMLEKSKSSIQNIVACYKRITDSGTGDMDLYASLAKYVQDAGGYIKTFDDATSGIKPDEENHRHDLLARLIEVQLKDKSDGFSWDNIKGIRDVLAHPEDKEIDYDVLMDSARDDYPRILALLQRICIVPHSVDIGSADGGNEVVVAMPRTSHVADPFGDESIFEIGNFSILAAYDVRFGWGLTRISFYEDGSIQGILLPKEWIARGASEFWGRMSMDGEHPNDPIGSMSIGYHWAGSVLNAQADGKDVTVTSADESGKQTVLGTLGGR